jgi:hypothetical protein
MEQMGSLGVAKKRINTFNDSCPTEISQDRRSKRRYPIELPLHYKIVKNCLTLGVGKGSIRIPHRRGKGVSASRGSTTTFDSDAPVNTTSTQSSSEGSSLLRGIVRCNGAEASHLAMFGRAIVLIRFARQRSTLQPTTIAICIFPETKNIS